MTVEELEILVEAKIEPAIKEIKKLMPQIRQTVSQATETANKAMQKVNTEQVQGKIKQTTQKIKKHIDDLKKSTESNEIAININNKDAEKQISQLKKEIDSLQKKISSRQMKLAPIAGRLDIIQEQATKEYTPDGVSSDNPAIQNTIQSALQANTEFRNLSAEEAKIIAEIKQYNQQLDVAKAKIEGIKQETKDGASSQGKWSSHAQKFNGIMQQAGGKFGKLFNGIKKVTNGFKTVINKAREVKDKLRDTFGGNHMSGGIRSVLKYAGALFSLRSIYNLLSQSASAWLSSQNAEAQQLSANINYMKYALGSALAPVIQFVTNLMYQLLKVVQQVAYALTGVNIFAKASASSMNNTASSAKKAAKEAKQLAGFDEINNLNDSDSSDSGNGSGDVAPNIDLSSMDLSNSLIDAIRNGDWYEIGFAIGEKLNEVMRNIPWDKIQEGAKSIASNIADFINGFVDGTDWNLLGNTIAQGINTAIIFVNTLLDKINFGNIGKAIANFLNSAIKNTDWELIGDTIGTAIKDAIDFAFEFVTNLKWNDIGTSLGKVINNMFKKIDTKKAAETLSTAVKGIFTSITSFLEEVNWEEVGRKIGDFLANLDYIGIAESIIKALGAAILAVDSLGTGLGEAIYEKVTESVTGQELSEEDVEKGGENLWKSYRNGVLYGPLMGPYKPLYLAWQNIDWEKLGDSIKTGIDGQKEKVTSKWNEVKGWFTEIKAKVTTWFTDKKEDLQKKWNELTGVIKDKVATMRAKIGTKWNDIKKKWNDIKNNIKDKTATMKAKIGTKWGQVKKTWKDLMDKFKDKIINVKIKVGGIIENVKGYLNQKIIDPINSKLPWGKIPRLATGNVAYKEMVGVFGEYAGASSNPEITAPQSILRETFEDVMSDFATNNNNNEGAFKQLVIQFGSYRVANEMENLLRKAQRMNGTATVTI